jgi:hypothetical protein
MAPETHFSCVTNVTFGTLCTVEAKGGPIKRRYLAVKEPEKTEPGARVTTKALLSHIHEASASNPQNRAASIAVA